MGELIGSIFKVVIELVGGFLGNAKEIAAFKKSGEIQNAVIDNFQDRYSNLEEGIKQAAIEQYGSQIEEDTEKKVLKGNIISVIVVIIMVMITFMIIWFLRKK